MTGLASAPVTAVPSRSARCLVRAKIRTLTTAPSDPGPPRIHHCSQPAGSAQLKSTGRGEGSAGPNGPASIAAGGSRTSGFRTTCLPGRMARPPLRLTGRKGYRSSHAKSAGPNGPASIAAPAGCGRTRHRPRSAGPNGPASIAAPDPRPSRGPRRRLPGRMARPPLRHRIAPKVERAHWSAGPNGPASIAATASR